MRMFTLHLQSATQYDRIDDVLSFIGEDASGSFGILAGHARMMTSLAFGLARFRRGSGAWQFLALPEALLYFTDNELLLSTRHYFVDEDYHRVRELMAKELRAEEAETRALKESLGRLEKGLLKHLLRIKSR